MKSFSRILSIVVIVLLGCSAAIGQKGEVTVSVSELFFEALLDSIFQNLGAVEFPIADLGKANRLNDDSIASLNPSSSQTNATVECKEVVRILRETGGVKTGVRFRQGKINAPLAFSAGYSPPFVGCVEIAGWADTTIDLEFDAENQRLIGRARVQSVNLNGTGGVGSSVIAKLIQASIDKRINPIEIIKLDKLSFLVPVHNAGNLRMKAVGARTEVVNGSINIHVTYEFLKG